MNYMKKILFGIFAHPDDEAFGPSGTLLKMSRTGVDIHLVCATSGQAGCNPDNHPDLGALRLQEWHKGGELIGAATMNELDYEDGKLSNSLFHDIARTIEDHITTTIKSYGDKKVELSLMTFDRNGISGHIDHIVMSLVTSYVFARLKDSPPHGAEVKELHYFCIDSIAMPAADTHFVYMPAGRKPHEIDITIDISDVAEEKRTIMLAHHSQRQDALMLLSRETTLRSEHFYLAR